MTKSGKFGWFAAVVLVGCLCVSAGAQTNQYSVAASAVAVGMTNASVTSNEPDDSILTIRKRVDEVNVLFIATDRHGKFVRNLSQTDFSIFDDHKPVESILNFRRETDLPIE